MPIKELFLEQKWYYRVAKVFFSILPLLVAVVLFLKGYINIRGISEKNILDILQKNSVYIVYAVIGLVLYFLILKVIWRGFLYIAFGGLEDDTEKKVIVVAQSVNPAVQPASVQDNGLGLLFLIIIIIIATYFMSPSDTPQKSQYIIGNTGNKTSKCVPTGCGSLWRCSGSYYISGVQIRVSGACFPSGSRPGDIYSGWSGKCRQCP